MLAQHRVAKRRPVAVVLPARVRHDPVEVVEQARDQQVPIALRLGELGVDRQAMLADEMGEDGLAVADDLAVVDDVGELAARGMRGVDDVLVTEGNAAESQEGVDLQTVAVVVGDAEEPGVRVERQHRLLRCKDRRAAATRGTSNLADLRREQIGVAMRLTRTGATSSARAAVKGGNAAVAAETIPRR